MRGFVLTSAWLAATLLCRPVVAADDAPLPAKTEHPGEVALTEESDGYAYLGATSHLRLYISDHDPPGKSACDESCSLAWPPLVARDGAKPMGYWTIVKRDDGRRQWAYKGHPVYFLFHDSPDHPVGNDADGGLWHFLEP